MFAKCEVKGKYDEVGYEIMAFNYILWKTVVPFPDVQPFVCVWQVMGPSIQTAEHQHQCDQLQQQLLDVST